ncbi:BON domain-containing protein [Flavobacterium sp. JLP]|uniref:BON domain-containing protein n=1 Tax=unclassified Flavobacterium TaxID=196869 RepID=UPI00188D17DB|nr:MULTISPECIES: BON domain-containing protein [unclassified Flavobacterium]MBF4494253.1 BON domain-containing protein [Flavobacterium sp. MR2016-29]MBF4507645.1 BON domain-containing protein [Flavobacterium sp. JLP]
MKTNEELQRDVQNAIKWEPQLHAAEIGVTAKDGIVTLMGTVDAYYKKTEAENAAKNVDGVKAVVEEIEVKYSNSGRTDEDIASDILKALIDSWNVPQEKIQVKVEKGWVTLEGQVTWNYQKEAASKSIEHLNGVKSVTNRIKIKAEVQNEIEKKNIKRALASNWTLHSENILVKVDGTKVTLTGGVSSLHQKELAEKIVWKTPGIWAVDNQLVVEYKYTPVL